MVAPAPSLSIADVSAKEGDAGLTSFVFTVTRSGDLSGTTTVNYTTTDGAATTTDGDYTASSGTLTFAANDATKTITVSVSGDTKVETDESFTVTLSSPSTGATISKAAGMGTIINDDASLSVSSVTQAEGNSGTSNLVFTITRAGDTTNAVSFTAATVDGTATAGSDYVAQTLNGLTIAAGATTAIFTVVVNGDTTVEPDETFNVHLSGVNGATAPTADGVGTIANDDVVAPGVIPDGTQNTAFGVTTPGTYTLLSGTTRTQTAATAVTASGAGVTVDIEGTLNETAAGMRAVNFAAGSAGLITVGAAGVIQNLNNDTVRVQATTTRVDLSNLGQIISGTSSATVSLGGTNPGTGFALNLNTVTGAAGAAATDYTSGGTITNGAVGNTAALIRSDSGDAIRLGSHQTLVNYGMINGAGPVNDASTNNTFSGTSTAQTYDVSRGVRLNQAGAKSVDIENKGTITGAQHGIDVGVVDATGLVVNNFVGATITGRNGSGVGADTTGAAATTVVVNNSGTITGAYAPTFDRAGLATTDGDGDGVDVDGGATVNNLAGGMIRGTGAGGFDSGGRANKSEGLSLGGGVVDNFGTISGADYGITVNNDSNADKSRGGIAAASITNEVGGKISGDAGFAIRIEAKTGTAADNDTVVNRGTITGAGGVPTSAVLLQNNAADPNTIGTLDGVTYTSADAGSARFIAGDGSAIQTGEGADTLSNYGVITAATSGRAVNLEGGADTLNLFTGSTVNGRLDGGAGSDTLNLAIATGTTGTLGNVVNFEILHVASGVWTLTDAQAYSASITIDLGATLQVGSGAMAGSLSGGGVIDNGALVFNRSDAITQGQALSGSGTLSQIGAGVLTLNAASTFTGGVLLNAGALNVAVLGAAGTGAVTFGGGAQILTIEKAALSAQNMFANTLKAFGVEDTIDLHDVGVATSATLGAGNVLTVSGGIETAVKLQLDPGVNYTGTTFTTSSDGVGGTKIAEIAPPTPPGSAIWINEINYDTLSTDTNEFVEIAVATNIDLTGYKLVLYNGSGGASYATYALTDLVATSPVNGVGFIRIATPGIQNGSPDGLALVGPDDAVIEFLSYEGTFTATNGAANGLTSIDIGVVQAGDASNPATGSIQRTGTFAANIQPNDPGTWVVTTQATNGSVNTGQTINVAVADTTAPTLTTSTPADNATAVNAAANLSLTFSERVKAGAGSIVLHPDTGADVTIAAADASQVTIAGATVTINPAADLAYNTHYQVLVGATAIADTSNNAFAGTMGGTLDFTTGGPPPPSLSIADVTVAEGDSGQTALVFTVTRAGDLTGTSTVQYATADGTATLADTDYVATSGSLTFMQGQTTATFTVQVNGDVKAEANEAFTVNLSAPSMGTILTRATATGTIQDDDTPVTGIADIQGAAQMSPLVGKSVTTQGVVTAIKTGAGGGFYIQDNLTTGPAGASHGLFVFTNASPANIAVGDAVRVTGLVTEYVGGDNSLPVTELNNPIFSVSTHNNPVTPIIIGAGGILPPTTAIAGASYDPAHNGIDFYESLEGQLVTVKNAQAVDTSFGSSTWVVAENGAGATGINARGGITITADDSNPERIQVFSSALHASLGEHLGDITGVITYYGGEYELIPTAPITAPNTPPAVADAPPTTLKGDATHLTFATYNVENLDPGDPAARFNLLGYDIATSLGGPDIITLEEVQDADGAGAGTDFSGAATLNKLIAAISAAGGPAYQYIDIAPTASTGGEPNGHIQVAFLYNPARVGYVAGSAELIHDATPLTGTRTDHNAFYNSREPLRADFTFNGQTITAVGIHNYSRSGSEELFGAHQPATNSGDDVRLDQCTEVGNFLQAYQQSHPGANIVVAGDFNAFYFEPSLQILGTINGLTNLVTTQSVNERYSTEFEGLAQQIDNILVAPSLATGAQLQTIHVNTGQSADTQASDHDPVISLLSVTAPTPVNTAPVVTSGQSFTAPENQTAVGTIAATDADAADTVASITFSTGGTNDNALFNLTSAGVLSFRDAPDFEATSHGPYTVSVVATDSRGLTGAAQTVSVAVANVNEAPVVTVGQTFSAAENQTAVGAVLATDPDANDTRTFALAGTAADNGLFTISTTGVLTFKAAPDFEGTHGNTYTVGVQAVDALGLTSAVTPITVVVTDVAETVTPPPPTPTPTPPTPTQGQTVSIVAEAVNLFRSAAGSADALDPKSPIYAQFQAATAISAQLAAGTITQAAAQTALAHLVDGTISVATLSYAFFTGKTPTADGLDYLVHSTSNPTDLNDAYYSKFNTDNRYINFAASLAKGGAGTAAYHAGYDGLSLTDATTKAYATIFGAAPVAGKIDAILNTLVPDGVGGQETRAQYFAYYGGDGLNGAGTKAAAIGFLLADAIKEGIGPYNAAEQHFLTDLGAGSAQFNVDLVGTYGASTPSGSTMVDVGSLH